MAIPIFHANAYLESLLRERSPEELAKAMRPKPEVDAAPRIPRDHRISPRMVEKRWALFPGVASAREQFGGIADSVDEFEIECLSRIDRRSGQEHLQGLLDADQPGPGCRRQSRRLACPAAQAVAGR